VQRLARPILIQAVQVETAGDLVTAPHDTALAPRLDGLRRGIGVMRLRRRLRVGGGRWSGGVRGLGWRGRDGRRNVFGQGRGRSTGRETHRSRHRRP
jgi:hypothetical protein